MMMLVTHPVRQCLRSVKFLESGHSVMDSVSAKLNGYQVIGSTRIQTLLHRGMCQMRTLVDDAGGSPENKSKTGGLFGNLVKHHPIHTDSIPQDYTNNHDNIDSLTMNLLPFQSGMQVLGIESSCDDTAASVVRGDGTVLSDSRHSQQNEMLELYGGVYPKQAAIGHAQHIDKVVEDALVAAKCSMEEIDLVAVTIGPGLAPCLRVGLDKAKDLVKLYNKPIMCINHLEAHALTARLLDHNHTLEFPFMVLLVSGGNCQLVLAEGVGVYRRLGQTLDDAPGEAFDKTARILNIETNEIKGGVAVEQASARAQARGDAPVAFGEPMLRRRDCNFSFAGLKTALRRKVRLYAESRGYGVDSGVQATEVCTTGPAQNTIGDLEQRRYHDNLAAGFQNAVFDQIVRRSARALLYADKKFGLQVKTVVISGGVAANGELRRRMTDMLSKRDVNLVCPPVKLCTDNAVMIAWAAIERCRAGIPVETDPDAAQAIRFHPDWPLGIDISKDVAAAKMKAW